MFQFESTPEGSDRNALDLFIPEDKFAGNVSRRLSSGSFSSLSSQGSTNPTTIGSDASSRAAFLGYGSHKSRYFETFEHASNRSTNEPSRLEAPEKYVCWDHGCNGRQFSSLSDLEIHQREKSGVSREPDCHRCGEKFATQTARDKHIQYDMCKSGNFEASLFRVFKPASKSTYVSIHEQFARGRDRRYVTSLENRLEGLQNYISELRTRKAMGMPELCTVTDSQGINIGIKSYAIVCIACRDRKEGCDPVLPQCGHCKRAHRACEYFDAAKGEPVPRIYILELQNQIKELEEALRQWRSGDSPPDVVPRAPLGAFHSPALAVTDDRTLDEKITKTRLSLSDDALEDKATRKSKGGNETTFPHRPSTSTNSLEGNASKVRYRTVRRPLSVFNEDLHGARKTTLHQSDKISPQKLADLLKTRAPEELLLLDLRVSKQYSISRIRNALNLCIPVTLLDRPTFHVQKLADTFSKQSDKARLQKWRQTKFIVVYDAAFELPSESATSLTKTLNKFKNEGYQGETLALRGDYHTFASMFPEMVDNRPASAMNDSRPIVEPSPATTVSKQLSFKDKSFNNSSSEEQLATLTVVEPSTAVVVSQSTSSAFSSLYPHFEPSDFYQGFSPPVVDSLSARVANVNKEAAEEVEKGPDSQEMGCFPQILANQLSENSALIGCAGKPTDESTPAEVAKSLDQAATHVEPSPSNGVNDMESNIQIHATALHPKRRHRTSRLGMVSPWGTICKGILFQAILVAFCIHHYLTEGDLAKFMKRAEMSYSVFYTVYLGIGILMRRRYMAKLRLALAKMASVDYRFKASRNFHVLYGQEYTVVNSAKRYVESLTAEQWDWWPLNPSFRPLHADEVRIEWECESGHTHWSEFSKENVRQVGDSLGESSTGHRDASSSSDDSGSLGSQSSDGRSSPATTDSSFSGTPSDDADHEIGGSSEQGAKPPADEVAVNIVPPSNMDGYIMFGVQGSKRLQSSQTRLAQIDVKLCKDDDSFFDEMKIRYKQLRGYIRWIFSIWVFHTCEFIMFYKANPNEIMPGPKEMPPATDMDYRFAADRDPPILSNVFNAGFYGCNKACIKAKLDIMRIFHECKGRNHCGKYRILELLPKRQRKWSIDSDEEKDEAWGLHAAFSVSFYKVALYHLLILAGPTTFWGLWLRSWPTDWQNASVPFFAVAVLLSLFWLPFAHNAESKEKGKRMMA